MDDAVVDVKNLTVKFDDFFAVNDISFSVAKGEIFGFLGANGAGKTTTIRVLCGLLIPTSGNVTVAGLNINNSELAIKANVGYMSQKFTLYNDLTVEENMNFTADLRKLDRAKYLQRREELFKFIDFDRSVKTMVSDLPGGTKQQVSLVTAILHDPDIIFLDEPTAGVSPLARSLFWDLIRQLVNTGKTVFVTTHYMDEAEQCGRIALMREGKIMALDTPAGLKSSTFADPMFEFDPKYKLNFEELLALENEALFSYFEPYGLRFHATIRNLQTWEDDRKKFEEKFNIKTISPSLEDVFIKIVEAKHL